MMYWLNRAFMLLHRLFPRGVDGATLPLWPGSLAVIFLIGTAAIHFVTLRYFDNRMDYIRLHTQNGKPALLAALIALGFGLADWGLLAALPRLGLSYGGLMRGLIGITAIRLAVLAVVIAILMAVSYAHSFFGWSLNPERLLKGGLITLSLINLAIFASEIYGLTIEPFDLQTTQISLAGPQKQNGEPLRILHLTDTHVERITRREVDLIERVHTLKPDLILLTGDYVNLDYLDDPYALRDARQVLDQLHAPYGVYAVTGSVDTPPVAQALFSGSSIRLLQDEVQPLRLGEQTIYLVGVSNINSKRDAQAFENLAGQIPQDGYSILLYHTPDLIEVADRIGIDLYLAGHTHGGQVRLPFYGAIVTMSAFGKRFESGLYQLHSTTLYVSRGIGMEGMGLPRVRFLCPPEIVMLTLANKPTGVGGAQ